MRLKDFDYDLPPELVAQHPLPDRSSSRLLHLHGDSGQVRDLEFKLLPQLLNSGDLLVFNDTRVLPARLYGRKQTGGRVEFMIDRVLDDHKVLTLAGSSKPMREGQRITIEGCHGSAEAVVGEHQGELMVLEFEQDRVFDVLARFGHTPLPPYIRRDAAEKFDHTAGGSQMHHLAGRDEPDVEARAQKQDRDRYQTVYARNPGAVAAPTAGLHFDSQLLVALKKAGVRCKYLTLHVGSGTFQPIRVSDPLQHRMHAEWVNIPPDLHQAVAETRARGNRVIAVGTTSVRALETAAAAGFEQGFTGETDLFIYPGKTFSAVDAMITNFHLPRSSLLLLVCAFAGTQNTLAAYKHAVAAGYRFYSYGDAMFITRRVQSGTENEI